ncbi:hypothetical protein GQ53DRAFT_627891, partial [Thozetella sp. PMI_491]
LGGQAPAAVAAMWSMVAFVMVFVALRLYTRIVIVKQPGLDDLAYCFSAAFLLIYTAFIHLAATYGYGQDYDSLTIDNATLAVKWAMVGQSFAVFGMATAKTSLGLFLLRIVMVRGHRIAIYAIFFALAVASAISIVVFWCRCSPVESLYDRRVQGHCFITYIIPYAILMGVACVIADLFFAIFPWYFIWQLNMKRREKLTIAGSMSLGILAGACGIFRTIETQGFTSDNYTAATLPLIVWSAAEIAVTMVCMGIPVLRPVYRRVFLRIKDGSEGYKYYGQGSDGQGSAGQKGSSNMEPLERKKVSDCCDDRGFLDTPAKLGLRGPTARTRITGDNTSDEEILGSKYRTNANVSDDGILVLEGIRVE